MSNDEREEERAFLEGLKARTGRDLADWMAAIAAQGFRDKNEIIDWLRTQGLPFARASWLERIHRNGGKPIYAEGPVDSRPESAPTVRPASVEQAAGRRRSPAPRPTPVPKAEPRAKPPAQTAQEMEKLLSAAKGYRPLYNMLEGEIRKAIPDAVFAARDRYVSIGAPREFGAVTLHPTEVRLGLDLGDRPFDAQVQKAKLRGPGAAIGHMVVLTDARQVNEALLALIRAANRHVNGAGQ
ncbi:MAG: hypothetical protein J2P50_03650 [Hyphomicrobiaceae bacterium]|nr:hypothetical protein [Hyphomicrobiaceae bacterium]